MKKPDWKTIESEIRQEKAEALGRAGERLEQALREVEAFRQEFLGSVHAAQASDLDGQEGVRARIERKLAEHARLCEQARALRHSLIIQREAVGLWKHEDVDRQYPLPGPLALPLPNPPRVE
jgi:hypothetical protein